MGRTVMKTIEIQIPDDLYEDIITARLPKPLFSAFASAGIRAKMVSLTPFQMPRPRSKRRRDVLDTERKAGRL